MDELRLQTYVLSMPKPGSETASGPHRAYARKRRAWRFKPEHADEAFVEFDLADGSPWRLSLVVIGAGGFGFSLHDGRPEIVVGARMDHATVQVAGFRITGSLRVAHVNAEFAADTICGAEFTPATDADARKMAYLIARLEQRNERSG